ncbi:MAG: aminotransferase class V-fold PLP-dependent enzyme [Clostridia bacterium]|nr:aminotransferase class V-fold PLP-dependent enzyme [Clostridia bacterium]
MQTPIVDFIRAYEKSGITRFHMPGHKGQSFLGMESSDLTEIRGADSLYEADGIIAQSEAHAASLFGSGRTLYSTEGSSQCIRAMLHLALCRRAPGASRTVVAARNVHKAFVYAAALLDFDVHWLWPQASGSICSCPITAQALERELSSLSAPPAAVYITSPDYLGHIADVRALSQVCRKHGTLLLVDNAHGAYLHFLNPPMHPLDLGADMCCDSAHKTLPVLTGGAYLHIGRHMPPAFSEKAKQALALFGSTSPSYLTLASLDGCNAYLSDGYAARLAACSARVRSIKETLAQMGWQIMPSDPLRITLRAGEGLADHLRAHGIECEFSDRDFLVLMITPENSEADFGRLTAALSAPPPSSLADISLALYQPDQVLSIREALFAPSETISTETSVGRICSAPLVSCPPAIPIVISGERITQEAVALLQYYGANQIEVLAE